jgi:hypothetical protein
MTKAEIMRLIQSERGSLERVLADFHRSYESALARVEALTEEDLVDPQRFAWRKGDPLWHMVAANMWEHYQEHRESIEKWLEE